MKNMRKKGLTRDARQVDVVVLAVHLLKGHKKSVDTEDAAVKAHELAPGMFSWRKYPDQINLELVRVNLSNAKKTEYGRLLSGSGREGWRLSSGGLSWVNSEGKVLLSEGFTWNSEGRSAGSVDTVRKQREKARLMASSAWKDWTEDRPVSLRDAQDIFRIDDYSTEKLLHIKLVRLQSLFEDDASISTFLKAASQMILEKECDDE